MKRLILILSMLFLQSTFFGYEIVYQKLSTKTWKSNYLKFNPPVTILLPADYQTSGKTYPVIYAFDGQNLFEAKNSFAGEWKVDETLIRLTEQGLIPEVIVVGIHNTANRMNDYTPSRATTKAYGTFGGELTNTEKFILNELKPYIEKNYPASPQRKHNFIMGSSLGGLSSFYIINRNPTVFQGAACLSSSFWWDDKVVLKDMLKWNPPSDVKIYLDMGWYEGGLEETVADNREVYFLLRKKGLQDIKNLYLYEDPKGSHSEQSWSSRLYIPMLFLLGTKESKALSLSSSLGSELLIQGQACDLLTEVELEHKMKLTLIAPEVSISPAKNMSWSEGKLMPLLPGPVTLTLKHQGLSVEKDLYIYPDTKGMMHRQIELDSKLVSKGPLLEVISWNKTETNFTLQPSLISADKIIFRLSYPQGTSLKVQIIDENHKRAHSSTGKVISRNIKFTENRLTVIKISSWK